MTEAARARRELIAFVCESSWTEIRKRAAKFLERGGLSGLEEAATLVAEAEFRGKAGDTFAEVLWERLRAASHPLGWLPTRRTAMETKVALWTLSSDGTGSCASADREAGDRLPDGAAARLIPGLTPDGEATGAFRSILEASNGRAEAASFRLVGADAVNRQTMVEVAKVFLPLKSKAGAPVVMRVAAESAVRSILDIAISGGAYDAGAGAAAGRLGAWRTVRWLVGVDAATTFVEVERAVTAAVWVRWETEDLKWFHGVAWDGCIGCVREGRLGVVAWTDTD